MWQVYNFGKRNVFRLYLNESREGLWRKGRGRFVGSVLFVDSSVFCCVWTPLYSLNCLRAPMYSVMYGLLCILCILCGLLCILCLDAYVLCVDSFVLFVDSSVFCVDSSVFCVDSSLCILCGLLCILCGLFCIVCGPTHVKPEVQTCGME